MSAQVTITQLPTAGAITGTELVPIVQNGQTVQTTTSAIAGSPSQTQTFITKNQEPTLPNSRALSSGTGVGLVDGGAQSTLQITLNGVSGSLETSSDGIIAKSGGSVAGRTLSTSGSGLSITNPTGASGNPTFQLTGVAASIAALSGTGMLALTAGGTTVAGRDLTGTSSQIDVTNGNGSSGNPTFSIASNPALPGSAGVVLPSGTTAQRAPAPTNGTLRYNTTVALLEAYLNGSWTSLASGSGVTSILTGTGLTGGPITSTGTISIDVTGVTSGTYGSSLVVPVIAVNAQGQITSATNTTINAVTLTTGTISTTPSGSTDIANKSYVDTVAQGLDTKASVVAGTTANITLSGTQTIDGILLIAGDRVLVKNQTASADNGLYLCAAGAWTRTTDMDTWAEVPGAYVFVETGSTLADTGWVCTSNAGGTIGVTAITWAQFSGAGSGVSSITFGSTGLTPATATTGAVTVAGTLAVANGGTNITSYAVGDLIYASTTGVLSKLADVATGNALISGGVGTAPSYGKIGLTTHVSGTLPIANGGTNGTATPTANGITYGTGTTIAYTAAGTTGQVLTATTSGAPTWVNPATNGTVTSVSFTGGIITVATATTTPAFTVAGTSGGIPYFASTSTWATSALLAANALMVGGGAATAPSTVTTGTGVVTALGVNTGSSGAFVVNGGALGTPSSGTVTNLTGTASININGTVGATTTNTGAFTTVSATTVTATTGIFGGTF